ncbi:putative transcriptional regulator/DNA-binding XRE family transcriptional regulator [Sphingomonas kyeonggiensis]|uniref:Putative transcriptional regulator/DNA-binding XRE family transcriptional regulator n=1 Tax=Sphingomonas kyeonggiensis TaxID=1268553 RepID=A0A7W7K1T1_9SPHN|nr:short-chain fatty acyl-CoA regulator family protein [Sphingomonas kyeonggiensis]MBB4839127.1 putative transcriptional regulator/DNA-binding XRE family transcriptional regulator [Sphingomonas kyeonggiensis]
MSSTPRRRVFEGFRLRELRKRAGISQAAMATRLGISVSYLSQIENNDRPITDIVLVALSREFPLEAFGDIETSTSLLRTIDAATDASVPAERMEESDVRRGIEQQPLLARRMVALHEAWRRSQEQLRVLDDRYDSGSTDAAPLPWEEVRDWFQAEGNYIDAVDRSAETLAGDLDPDRPTRGLEDRLRWHGVRVVGEDGDGSQLSRFDPRDRTLAVNSALPPESRAFLLAHRLVRYEFENEMRQVVDDAGLASPAARELLNIGLANYAAGALLMPYGAFRDTARDVRHDIDRLRQRFGVSFEQACHRLSTLQRPGAAGLPFFFCRVDMAGNITKRHSATRLQFAALGGACPLWVVHEAVAIPDRILVQHAEMPDGTRYVSMAKGLVKPSGSYARPPRRYAVALGCEELHAADFVYADDLKPGGAATPIGASCRICPRTDCDQRAFPPAASAIAIDPDRRSVVPYAFR